MEAIKILFLLFSLPFIRTTPKKPCDDFFNFVCESNDKEDAFRQTNAENNKALKILYDNSTYVRRYIFNDKCENFDKNHVQSMREMLQEITPCDIKSLQLYNFDVESDTDICLLKMTVYGSEKHVSVLMNTTDAIFDDAKESEAHVDEADLKKKSSGLDGVKDWIEKFFVFHNPRQKNKDSPFQKSKFLYQKCNRLDAGGDPEGIAEVAEILKNIFADVRRKTEHRQYIACQNKGAAASCAPFSKALGELNGQSTTSLFSFRVLDLLRTSVDSSKRFGALMQPHFVGDYDANLRVNDCAVEDDSAIDFDGTQFGHHSVFEDEKALMRFSVLAKLTGLDINESELKDIVSFEKSLFKYSLGPEEFKTENIEKNATLFTHETLQRDFEHVANWTAFFDSLYQSTDRAAIAKSAREKAGEKAGEEASAEAVKKSIRGKGLVVFCKSFFFGLNKAMAQTAAKTVLDYTQLKAFYYFAHEQPAILSEGDRRTLGLTKAKDCFGLTASLFPQTVGRLIWHHYGLGAKAALIDNLIKNMTENFGDMIRQSAWLSAAAKEKAVRKAAQISRVIGVPPGEDTARFEAELYRGVRVRPSFAATLLSVLQNNHELSLRTLFDDDTDYLLRTAPLEANAAYNVRDNRLVVNPGLLMPRFLRADMADIDIYATFGFIIGHELTHSIGINGLLFDLDGIYGRSLDEATMKKYAHRVDALERQTKDICAVAMPLFSSHRGEKVTPVFDHVREEIIADLGGFRLALMSYADLVGPFEYRETREAFVLQLGKLFCERDSKENTRLKYETATHPTDECRMRLLSKTPDFEEIFKCDIKMKDLVSFW